jgi:hypothetical protein
MGFGSRAILAGSLGFAAAFVVACGGANGLLTAQQSSTLSGQLGSISDALSSHQCGAATNAIATLNNDISDLPQSVDTTLVKNLAQGAQTIDDLAQQCVATTSSQSTSTTTTSSKSSSSSSSSSSTTQTTATTSTPATVTQSTQTTTTTNNGGAGLDGTSTAAAGDGAPGGTGNGNGAANGAGGAG